MPFKLGLPELLIILAIVLVIFGAGKLPQVARSLGDAIREFRKGHTGEEDSKKPVENKAQEKESSPKA